MFQSQAGGPGRFMVFALAKTAGLALNAGVMHLAMNILGLPEAIAFAAATAASFVWNFCASKFVIFQESP
jgi:putative flippase GtrA